MHAWLQDLRYAFRMLRKNAGLTLVMLTSLAIGIGANSAIFSVVDALLLRPLPYPQPDRLADVWLHSPGLGIFRDWPSPGQYIDLQTENHSFEQMALAQSRSFTLTGREQPERIDGMWTQSSLLQMLGARPLLGRLLVPEEDKAGKPTVAILSDRLWKRLFNSDPGDCGQEHYTQRESVHRGGGAAAWLHAQCRSDAIRGSHGQDRRFSAASLGSRCGEPPGRRKL
jgi:MacB-like periplasmic core domain